MNQDLPSALAALQAAPGDPDAWKTVGLMIIAQGTPDHLGLFAQREKIAGDSIPLLFQALFNDEFVQNEPLRRRLLQFGDHMPWQNPLGVVVRFFSACAQLFDGNEEGARAFRTVADAIARNPHYFASVAHLARAPAFSRLITSPAETRVFWSDWGSLPHQHIQWPDNDIPAPGPEPIVFAACDGGYMERFGARFLDVVAGLGPVHIHVVNPKPGMIEAVQSSSGSALFLSHESVSKDRSNSPYYACARFFAADAVMQRYGRDMLMLDIDLERLTDLDRLFARTRDADISYFAMPTLMPWLRHHAAFILLRHRPSVRTFLQRFANLLSHQLPDAAWYVDQLCLASIISAYRQTSGDLTIAGLEQSDGFPFAHFVMPAGDDTEKEKLRREGTA